MKTKITKQELVDIKLKQYQDNINKQIETLTKKQNTITNRRNKINKKYDNTFASIKNEINNILIKHLSKLPDFTQTKLPEYSLVSINKDDILDVNIFGNIIINDHISTISIHDIKIIIKNHNKLQQLIIDKYELTKKQEQCINSINLVRLKITNMTNLKLSTGNLKRIEKIIADELNKKLLSESVAGNKLLALLDNIDILMP